MTEFDRGRWSEEPTELLVERVEKYKENDDAFFTELRILTGEGKGKLRRMLWWRTKVDGNPRKDTTNLLNQCTGKADAPSYELMNKKFETVPWYPQGNDYPIFTKIKKTGEHDPWA